MPTYDRDATLLSMFGLADGTGSTIVKPSSELAERIYAEAVKAQNLDALRKRAEAEAKRYLLVDPELHWTGCGMTGVTHCVGRSPESPRSDRRCTYSAVSCFVTDLKSEHVHLVGTNKMWLHLCEEHLLEAVIVGNLPLLIFAERNMTLRRTPVAAR